jgi:hypothetical protein
MPLVGDRDQVAQVLELQFHRFRRYRPSIGTIKLIDWNNSTPVSMMCPCHSRDR